MAIKKSELYSKLWEACDKLRGGMDASQYKDYILTLLYVKYVSDKFKDDPYPEVSIPEGGSFDDIVALVGKSNIGEGIDKILAKLAEANKMRGIIDNAHFNDESKLGTGKTMVDTLSGLVNIFRDPRLDFSANRAEGDDLIGDAYEYLMRNFATESGKSKGQFYTPAEVSRVIAKIIGIDQISGSADIYDPACGSGSLLIRAAGEAPCTVSIYGQEKDVSTRGLAKMNFTLHNRATGEVESGSTFSDPKYIEDGELKRFDFVVANPPFSLKNWKDGLVEHGRFDGYGDMPPEKNGDFAWLLHIIKSMKNTAKAAVILPHGVLFRGNAEETIRRSVIDRGLIKGIIGLPANLFYGTGIPACIIVLDKEDAATRKGIFMIDASRDFVKDGNKNRLRERDVYKIVSTFRERIETDSRYARFVPMSEIKEKNDYNLNISRYIDGGDVQDEQNIDAHLHGGIPATNIESLSTYWEVFTELRARLFSQTRPGSYDLTVPAHEVRNAISSDKEFASYSQKIDASFAAWREAVLDRLSHISSETDAKQLIADISEELLHHYAPISLIDKYDIYQVLNGYWVEAMADDVYLIRADGYGAAREYEDIMGVYESGKKKGQPKKLGWDGKLIPKRIIETTFFQQELAEIEQLEIDIEGAYDGIAGMMEMAIDDPEQPLYDFANDDTPLNEKKLKAAIKEAKRCKDSALIGELDILLSYFQAAAEHKEALKAAKAELEKKLLTKYKALTDAEILDLLIDKKWMATVKAGLDSLYRDISHRLTARIVELAERYAQTLPEIEHDVAEYESRVKAHLKRMGFADV